MTFAGNCYDNDTDESFFGTLLDWFLQFQAPTYQPSVAGDAGQILTLRFDLDVSPNVALFDPLLYEVRSKPPGAGAPPLTLPPLVCGV